MPTEYRSKSRRKEPEASSKRSSTSKSSSRTSDRKEDREKPRSSRRNESSSPDKRQRATEASSSSSRKTREDTYVTLRDGSKKRVAEASESHTPSIRTSSSRKEKAKSSSKEMRRNDVDEVEKKNRRDKKRIEEELYYERSPKKKEESSRIRKESHKKDDKSQQRRSDLLSQRRREDTYEIHRDTAQEQLENQRRIREKTMDLDKVPTSSSASSRKSATSKPKHTPDDDDDEVVMMTPKAPLDYAVSHGTSSNPVVEDVPKPSAEEEAASAVVVDDDYYDDDFEDYEDDDFEEESEEEAADDKMDSGNYESARLIKEMNEVKAAMQRENSAANYERSSSARDQQYHDSGHGSNDEMGKVEQQPRRKPSGKSTVNFASAKQRQKSQIVAGKAKKRGDELLTMIRLDVAKYDLFDLPPIAYEALMAGHSSNRVQATCQTGEDDLDEELQTDPIDHLEKWTQHPPPPLTSLADSEDMEAMMQTLHGVGGQTSKKPEFNHESMKSINAVRLSKFLESASQALITLLEEDAERKYGTGREGQAQKDVVFSEKVTLLNTDAVKSLSQRAIVAMSFAPDQPCLLLTAHGPLDDYRSYLTIWNVSSPMQPLHILVTSGSVSSVCFSPSKASMAFAGMMDGSISVWDLRESQALHQEVIKVDFDDERIHRSPTFTTSSGEETSHDSAVTGLKPLPEVSLEGTYGDTFQIVSCEELGRVIIWTVLDSLRDSDVHLGLAHWGCVRIVNSVQTNLDCISAADVIFGGPRRSSESRGGDLFVAMGNGHIHHGSVHAEHKPSPRVYKGELESNIGVRSLTFCPFGEQFILAGCDDGSVRLHSVTSEKPLITWPGSVDGQPIVQIIWSPSRPCVFYVLDSDSRIHLWDLGVGDIYPAHTVQFEDRVNVIGLNPELSDPRLKQMLALGMQNGRVEVHHLKADYRASDLKSCSKELDRFLHYVSIIV